MKREELNRAIAEFRSALTNPDSNATFPAQKLHNWLIQPLEAALKEANAKTIIYAPESLPGFTYHQSILKKDNYQP